jgi:esterase/lipase
VKIDVVTIISYFRFFKRSYTMKKFLKWFLGILVVLTVVYFLGPKPKHPVYNLELPKITVTGKALDSMIAKQESAFDIKPENESRIIWADSTKQETEYSIVYLHGFTASQEEADPIHTNIAKKFGCNLYLPRLYGHGLKDTLHALEDFTADKFWETNKQALAIAKQIGNKVIIMSTSSGGTTAIKLLAEYDGIAANIMMSPNMAINDPNAWILNNHWGKQIATLVKGGNTFLSKRQDSAYKQYWTHRYKAEGAVELQELIETIVTNSNFKKVTEPTLLLYYYKDEQHQDPVVKVSAMKDMYGKIATPANKKQEFAIPNANNHVIGSYLQSSDLVTVEEKITNFMTGVLGMKMK